MQPYPYGQYVYPGTGEVPVRYMVPGAYRQASPPFANQAYNRYPAHANMPRATTQPIRYPGSVNVPPGMTQPVYYPSDYPQPNTMMPNTVLPPQQPVAPVQLRPPLPYYYNPYGTSQENPSTTPDPNALETKKAAKEYKEAAFTIAPEGADGDKIKGLVSNNDINALLKHKGTKVKVSKIYRITKTKPEVEKNDSSDEDLLPPLKETASKDPPQTTATKASPQVPAPPLAAAPPPKVDRSASSSSCCSSCSSCSRCSCSGCDERNRSHSEDDCPECRAERSRQRSRQHRRR